MARSIRVFAVGVLLTASVVSARAEEARLERSGSIATSAGIDVPQFVVVIGRPEFDDTRAPLVGLVGLYQANAVHWIRRVDGTWIRLEYRVPLTVGDSAELEAKGLEAITVRREVGRDELPALLSRLPEDLLMNVASALQFYSGAFRLYLRNQSEGNANGLAAALNGAARE